MTATAKIHAYIINLEKSTDRMAHMRQEIEALGVPYTRIEAVYGPDLPEPIQEFDEKRFNLLTGKHKNPREIGCYLSHIKAFKAFLEGDSDYALILEDDVQFTETLQGLINEALKYKEHWNLLRLSTSRSKKGSYIEIAKLNESQTLAYPATVLKSAGAYLISRSAAAECLPKLLPMKLPYDVAIDRDWDFNIKSACIVPFPVKHPEEFPSEIIHKAKRIKRYRTTTFHLFHLLTYVQRIKHRKSYARDAGILKPGITKI